MLQKAGRAIWNGLESHRMNLLIALMWFIFSIVNFRKGHYGLMIMCLAFSLSNTLAFFRKTRSRR